MHQVKGINDQILAPNVPGQVTSRPSVKDRYHEEPKFSPVAPKPKDLVGSKLMGTK